MVRKLSLGIFLLALALTIVVPIGVLAAWPHLPLEDTFTDRNNVSATHGSDINLFLSASNPSGTCVDTTNLWYKFSVPATASTIGTANLILTFNVAGSGTTDLELLGGTDTSWSETSLTWEDQAAILSGLTSYARATGAQPGATVTLTDPDLSDFLTSHRGETVTLVVRADCTGTVGTLVALAVASKENANGSGTVMELYTPTAVAHRTLSANSISREAIWLNSGLIVVCLLIMLFRFIYLQRRPNR